MRNKPTNCYHLSLLRKLHLGYFRKPHWKSMGLLEISRVTWQVCHNKRKPYAEFYSIFTTDFICSYMFLPILSHPIKMWDGYHKRGNYMCSIVTNLTSTYNINWLTNSADATFCISWDIIIFRSKAVTQNVCCMMCSPSGVFGTKSIVLVLKRIWIVFTEPTIQT